MALYFVLDFLLKVAPNSLLLGALRDKMGTGICLFFFFLRENGIWVTGTRDHSDKNNEKWERDWDLGKIWARNWDLKPPPLPHVDVVGGIS